MVEDRRIFRANDEILGGIRSAILRGETLKEAMMTLYAAGYNKEEIEETARAYVSLRDSGKEPSENPQRKSAQEVKEEVKPVEEVNQNKQVFSPAKTVFKTPIESKKPKVVQRVSDYKVADKKKSSDSGKILTIMLVVILVLLLGVLAAVFLFKEELVNFFNSMFG